MLALFHHVRRLMLDYEFDIAMPFATFLDAAVPDPVIVKVSPPCKASKLLNVEPAAVVVASYCLLTLRSRVVDSPLTDGSSVSV